MHPSRPSEGLRRKKLECPVVERNAPHVVLNSDLLVNPVDPFEIPCALVRPERRESAVIKTLSCHISYRIASYCAPRDSIAWCRFGRRAAPRKAVRRPIATHPPQGATDATQGNATHLKVPWMHKSA